MYRVEEKVATFRLPKNCMVAMKLEMSFDAKFLLSSLNNVAKVKENAIVIVIQDKDHVEILREFLYMVDHTLGPHSVDIVANAVNNPKVFNEMRQERVIEIWASSLNIDPWDMQVLNVNAKLHFQCWSSFSSLSSSSNVTFTKQVANTIKVMIYFEDNTTKVKFFQNEQDHLFESLSISRTRPLLDFLNDFATGYWGIQVTC